MSVELLPDIRENGPGTGDDGYVVIVYDNDKNTFDEVEHILLRATNCSVREAKTETWEVHHLGKSIVHHAPKPECEQIAALIRTIGIQVEVRAEFSTDS